MPKLWEIIFPSRRRHRGLDAKLDRLLELTLFLARRLHHMSAELDTLTAAVTAENTVIDSAIALIEGLAAQIASLPADSAAIAQLAVDVKAKSDALAAAVAAQTPAVTPEA